MSRDPRKMYYHDRGPRISDRDLRDRNRDQDMWDRPNYRNRGLPRKRSVGRSPSRGDAVDKRRSRSPRKNEKDLLDDNILSEISKLPEPSELWDSQFQEDGYAPQPPPAPTFQPEVPTAGYGPNYQPSYSGIYDDFPPVAQSVPPAPAAPSMSDMANWNQMSLPPPPTSAPPVPLHNFEEQIKKEAAIETEMRHQKAALSKQREDYIKKASILKKELDTLKDQRNELRGDVKRSPSPDTKRFLKENTKLQLEIQNKLKTIMNVVDMLNNIIGEEAQDVHISDESDREAKRKSRSPSSTRKFNYVYYDPELHWCRVCNEFPPTAKDYLNHLHSPAHHKMAAAHMEAPWHSVSGVNEGFPSFTAAPTKRTPIRGLQFFVPSTAWYCKLCDQFIGDLHCASAHLKSVVHSKNYTNFVEQNPHWETDWMSDRQKAFEKSRATKSKNEEKPQYSAHTITFHKDGFHTKHKKSVSPVPREKRKKEKKKKSKRKHSTSSSSSSNSSSLDSEPVKKKKKKNKKMKRAIDMDDKTFAEWVSNVQVDRLNDNDRKLIDNLKHRIQIEKNDKEERRSAGRERVSQSKRIRESERHESRAREERDRERRRDDRRDRRDDLRRISPMSISNKKQEVKKMPFIGKMPVYKSLCKKTDEQKKDEMKKKEEDEVTKKKREEMDAEIQKKVAEFKEKIAKAQLERQLQQVELGPPMLLAPPPGYLPPPATPQPNPTPVTQPALPKDFQEALDIIFPTEVKNQEMTQQDLYTLTPGFMPPMGGVMQPFPGIGIMQAPQMFGFDMNSSMFPPPPQLYDTHVPLVPSPKTRPQKNNRQQKQNNQLNKMKNPLQKPPPIHGMNNPDKLDDKIEENGSVSKKKEVLDDLALLGIDATDVGAGI